MYHCIIMIFKKFKNIKVEEQTHDTFEELRNFLRFKKGIVKTQDGMILLLIDEFNKKISNNDSTKRNSIIDSLPPITKKVKYREGIPELPK